MSGLVLFFLDPEAWILFGIIAYVLLFACDYEASRSGKKLVLRGNRSVKERGWKIFVLAVLLMPISLLLAIVWVLQLVVSESRQQKQ